MLQRRIFRILIILVLCLFILFFIFLWYADKTNPYSKNTDMTPAYIAVLGKDNQFVLKKQHSVTLREDFFSICIVHIQAAIRIVADSWNPIKPIKGNEQTIIKQIHRERFDPTKAYDISGDHFVDFYPRNNGTFYAATLDGRIPSSSADWENRQKIMLQTTAFYLTLLSQSKQVYTTYMPLSNTSFVGVNIWSYPSDSLYAVLFDLSALTKTQFISYSFPVQKDIPSYPLQTTNAGNILLQTYRPILKDHIQSFENYVLDPKTALVKKNLFLSGVRDGVQHESSFYDNVIVWATAKLANDLGILPRSKQDLEQWRQQIIAAFWDNKDGIFLEDLSTQSKQHHIFSADSLIIVQTKFLDLTNSQDKEKLFQIISYVKKNHLDNPFPLPWSTYNESNNMVFLDRYIVPNYEQNSLFSHWTMEYIKMLLLVSKDHPECLIDAHKFINIYSNNIKKYGGYPEIYLPNGDIFKIFFYKSVLHTGWVVNYEQTKMMVENN